MKKNIVVIICAMLCCSVYAGTMGVNEGPLWHRVLTLNLGPAWSAPGQTQTIFFSPTFPQTYDSTSDTVVFGVGELFLGLQREVAPTVVAQLGLALAATTPLQLKGDIWQDADPEFNNFVYKYKISHSHIAIRGKLIKDMHQWVQPYVSGSLGVGFNHAYQYVNTPRIFEVAPEPPFGSHTTTALTYTLDIGVQKTLNEHWSFGVGYEFADWGKTTLGKATNQLSGMGLQLNHVYTNGLQFYLSFLA